MVAVLIIFFCYGVGSIPTGLFISSLYGVDLRKIGSGNTGATNVTRALGWKWGGVTFLIDALKAAGGVWFAKVALFSLGGNEDAWLAFAAAALLLGNCYPMALRFRGGKGVATTLGLFLPLSPPAVLIAGLTYGMVFSIVRVSALGSLTAVSFLLLSLITFPPSPSPAYLYLGLFTTTLVLFRHKENLKKLFTQ